MVLLLPLNRDGLVDNLLYYLWHKDEVGKKPLMYLPHTIVYSCSQPSVWYFTSNKTSRIKKKNKSRLTEIEILKSFTKGTLGSNDIVAYFIHGDHGDNFVNRSLNASASPATAFTKDAPSCAIEYFNTDRLQSFLKHREQGHYNTGILQKFVYPRGGLNSIIRAVWSPKLCLLERRTNYFGLYDTKYSIHERAVTYDGPDRFSYPDPIHGTMLAGQAQLLCHSIVEHVWQVTHHKTQISRMVLHLKADEEERLWLLWCSSLRTSIPMGSLKQEGHLAKQVIKNSLSAPNLHKGCLINVCADPKVPLHVFEASALDRMHSVVSHPESDQNQGIDAARDSREAEYGSQWSLCTSCGHSVLRRKMVGTTYKSIIQHYQKFLLYFRKDLSQSKVISAIAWPPEEHYVEAAGNIGFGLLNVVLDKRKVPLRLRDTDAQNTTAVVSSASGTFKVPHFMKSCFSDKDWMVPPILQYLHPLLTIEEFKRHRHDPIFLQKEAAVCEGCCLVFLDYATNALEGNNSTCLDAPKILRAPREITAIQQRLDSIDHTSPEITVSTRKETFSEARHAARRVKRHISIAEADVGKSKTVIEDRSMRKDAKNYNTTRVPRALDVDTSKPQIPLRIVDFRNMKVHEPGMTPLNSKCRKAAGDMKSAWMRLVQSVQGDEKFLKAFEEYQQQKEGIMDSSTLELLRKFYKQYRKKHSPYVPSSDPGKHVNRK